MTNRWLWLNLMTLDGSQAPGECFKYLWQRIGATEDALLINSDPHKEEQPP